MDEKYTSNENNTNNDSASSDSLYSYSYRDKEQSETTHQGTIMKSGISRKQPGRI